MVSALCLCLLAVTIQRSEEIPNPSFVESLSKLSDTMQNLYWLGILAVTVIGLLCAITLFRKRFNKFSKGQIDQLKSSGKYIPGLFVELNESKEALRYFIKGSKWKLRLINAYNLVYDNFYGDILKTACEDLRCRFYLGRFSSIKKIQKSIDEALILHENFGKRTVKFKPGYEESRYLFEILHYPYTSALEELQLFCEAADSRYFILTGSAGNGKTNLLCSICELAINSTEAVLFLNARDIDGNITSYLAEQLRLPKFFKKNTPLYFSLVNALLLLRRKHLFIIIDAVNENVEESFSNNLAEFVTTFLQYRHVKIILSCRNEYYKERFRKSLVENVDFRAMEYDLKTQSYDSAALNRMVKAYSRYFNFSGSISPAAFDILSKQLLLLRIFFEIYTDSNEEICSVRKHQLFSRYIEMVECKTDKKVGNLLERIANSMLDIGKYDDISLKELENLGIDPALISKVIDGSILISKKIVHHDGTIARTETESIFFVFDEMRDYLLARQIILRNSHEGIIDAETILRCLNGLKNTGAVCAEGVIHYAYVFFRTDDEIAKQGRTDELCSAVLKIYRIADGEEHRSYMHTHHREEFLNLGMRIIMTTGLPLSDFEKSYIRSCLSKAPKEDSGVLFDALLRGTINGGENDLDDYLDIILGFEKFGDVDKVLRNIFAHGELVDVHIPDDLPDIHANLVLKSPENALQVQKVSELILLCYKFKDRELQEKLTNYYYALPDHSNINTAIKGLLGKSFHLEVNSGE